MDDEFDDKGWDGDMGDGEVSKIIGILLFVSCFILWITHGFFLSSVLLFMPIYIKIQILCGLWWDSIAMSRS